MNYAIPDQMLSYSSVYPPISYPGDELAPATGGALTPSDVSSSISPPSGQVGNTKYSTTIPGDRIASALTHEEHGRLVAEEDRRRRNTAASARFRMKKKQREQTLERTMRDATEKNASLEARIAQLEMENRWLKNLLTEKHEAAAARMPPPPTDAASAMGSGSGSGSGPSRKGSGGGSKHVQSKKKGVGTDS